MKKKIEAKKVFTAIIVVVLALTVFSCGDVLNRMQKLEAENISEQGRSIATTASGGGSSTTGNGTGGTVAGSGENDGSVADTNTGDTVPGSVGSIVIDSDVVASTYGNGGEANSLSITEEATILSEGANKGTAVEESSGITTVDTIVPYEDSVTVPASGINSFADSSMAVVNRDEIDVIVSAYGNGGEANSLSITEEATILSEGASKENAVEESSGITTVDTIVPYEDSVTVPASGINSFADGSMAVVDNTIKTYNVDRVSAIQQLTNNGGVYTVVLTGAVDNGTINKIRNALQGNSDVKIYLDLSLMTELEEIPDRGFKDCVNLAGIVLPDSVTAIYAAAFEGCTSLTGITLPESVTAIYTAAFERCTSLTDITIPKNVNAIGMYAFSGCSILKNVTFSDPSGWASGGNNLEDLSNPKTAANYLKSTYVWSDWKKSNN